MLRKITILSGIITAGMMVFLGGYIFHQRLADNSQISTLALINNSLVDRFQEPTEKRKEPQGIFEIRHSQGLIITGTSKENIVIGYDPTTGIISEIDIFGEKTPTTIATIKPGAISIQWATNRHILLATYPDQAIFYNLDSHFSKTYDPTIIKPTLNKTGDKIAYIISDPETGVATMRIADLELKDFKDLLQVQADSWSQSWIDDKDLALTYHISEHSASVFRLNIETGHLDKLIDNQDITGLQWSADGRQFIYSYFDPATYMPRLVYFDLTKLGVSPLPLDNHAFQCSWSIDGKTIFCAPQDKKTTTFVAFDTSSSPSQPRTLFTSTDPLTVSTIFTTITEDYLLFTNSTDHKLYGLKI